jgi:hypothetical protein
MFSYKMGVAVAKIVYNNGKTKTIFLNSPDQNPMHKLSDAFKKKHKKMKSKDKKLLKHHLEKDYEPEEDDKLKKIYHDAMEDLKDNTATNCIKIDTGKIQPLPRADIVEKVYVTGVSGSGKSYFSGNYIKEYKKMNPKNDIYLFSSVDEDSAFDKYNPIRIDPVEYAQDEPFDVKTDLANTLCIFDDVDTLPTNIRKPIDVLRSHIIEIGRHSNSSILVTSHMISNYLSTRQILNEATSVTVFPKASGKYHINRYLTTHLGFNKQQIEKFHRLKSRAITLYRQYPSYIVWEKGICMVSAF